MVQRPRTSPSVPDVPSVTRALDRCDPLASLLQRVKMSQHCLAAVHEVLPKALLPHVRSGALDADGWTLLVDNPSISSKLRQLQPRLQEALLRRGLHVPAIRLRVQHPLS